MSAAARFQQARIDLVESNQTPVAKIVVEYLESSLEMAAGELEIMSIASSEEAEEFSRRQGMMRAWRVLLEDMKRRPGQG